MAVLRGMAILPLLYFSWQKKSIGLPNVDENGAKMPTQNCQKIQKKPPSSDGCADEGGKKRIQFDGRNQLLMSFSLSSFQL